MKIMVGLDISTGYQELVVCIRLSNNTQDLNNSVGRLCRPIFKLRIFLVRDSNRWVPGFA